MENIWESNFDPSSKLTDDEDYRKSKPCSSLLILNLLKTLLQLVEKIWRKSVLYSLHFYFITRLHKSCLSAVIWTWKERLYNCHFFAAKRGHLSRPNEGDNQTWFRCNDEEEKRRRAKEVSPKSKLLMGITILQEWRCHSFHTNTPTKISCCWSKSIVLLLVVDNCKVLIYYMPLDCFMKYHLR